MLTARSWAFLDMNEIRFKGIIIGKEDWGDVDRVIVFYTRELGKFETVARGVRYEKSKLKGHLELLTHGSFGAAIGRARPVLTDAIAEETYPVLRASPGRAYAAAAVAALYDAYLFPGMPDERLWELLLEELTWLNEAPLDDASALPRRLSTFFQRFLAGLGYGTTSADTTGRGLDALFVQTEFSGPKPSAILAALTRLTAGRSGW